MLGTFLGQSGPGTKRTGWLLLKESDSFKEVGGREGLQSPAPPHSQRLTVCRGRAFRP